MKQKTKKLYLLRWDKIKQGSAIWILFAVCLVVSFCTNAFLDDNSEASFGKAAIVVCNNICYGYIAGFVFYVLSQFLPETKKELMAKNVILAHIRKIIVFFDFIEKSVIPDERRRQRENDPFLLASYMVNEPIMGINLVSIEDNKIVSIKPDVIGLLTASRMKINEHLKVLSNYNMWLEYPQHLAINNINDFLNLSLTIKDNGHYIMQSVDLNKTCEDFYLAKQILKQYEQDLERYSFFNEDK